MAVRPVFSVKDARLREKSKPVQKADKKLLQLIKDLEDTLLVQNDPEGVGLAAPQIGVNLRVFVMRHRGKIIPVINPEILSMSEKTNEPDKSTQRPPAGRAGIAHSAKGGNDYIMEGCLSLPRYYGPVKRAWEVTLKYQTIQKPACRQARPTPDTWHLAPETRIFKGFPAQIIQHEIDHLDGKIFVDRLLEQKRKLYEIKGKRWEEVEV